LDILSGRPVLKIGTVTSKSEAVNMTEKVWVSVCGFEVNGELNGLVVFLDEAEIGVPVLMLGENDGITIVFCKLKNLRKKMYLQYL
jgi:hypothetical protein